MNKESQKLGNMDFQGIVMINFKLKPSVALLTIIVSLTVMIDAVKGNKVLSLTWPILLLPFFNASKDICILLIRLAGKSHQRVPGHDQGVSE